jgi:prophage antirepressor-like protein
MTDSPGTELVPFNYENHEIRTVLIDGEPWVVAKDVCDVLEIRTNDALNTLDDDEKGYEIVVSPGGPQQMAIVNEPGLYSLILRSRKPEAKKFKRWITHVVLPAMRRGELRVVSEPETLTYAPVPKPVELQVTQYQERAYNRRERKLNERGLHENRYTGEVTPLPGVVPEAEFEGTMDGIIQRRYRTAKRSSDHAYQTPAEFEKHAAWNDALGGE